MLIGRAKEKHLVATAPEVAGIKICGQLRTDKVAQMLDPVDVGDRRGDQMAGHGHGLLVVDMTALM